MSPRLLSLLLGSAIALAALPAAAQTVVFSNLGAGGSYSTTAAVWVGDDVSNQSIGYRFTASGSGTLNSIELALQRGGATGYLTLGLYTAGSSAPATLLQSWTIADALSSSLTYVPSFTPTTLNAGDSYYLCAAVQTGLPAWMWYNNSNSATGVRVVSMNGGAWINEGIQPQGAFRVSVVPEPSTYAVLCGVAALGLVVWRRRAKR